MRCVKPVLALAAGLLIGGGAYAQPPGGGGFGGGFGGFGGGGLVNAISRSKPLQEELKIDAAQLEKLTAAQAKAREETRGLLNRETPTTERAEIGKKIQEINTKAVESVLKPEQVKRLHQLENQQAGLNLFNKEDVAKTLNLTDEQKEKIKSINKDLAADRREILSAGGRGQRGGGRRGGGFGQRDPEITKKLESLQKEAIASAVKVLNDEQQKAYKDLTGEPFDLPPGTLAFGGGAAGPGFGGFGGGGGFGGFGGGFGGGVPGQVLSTGAQTQLKLTDEQKKELEALQKEVDSRLDKMLTEEQRTQLKQMKERRPGGGRQPRKDN